MKEVLIGLALNAAQNLVQHHVERKLSGASKFIDMLGGGLGNSNVAGSTASSGTGPSQSAGEPDWYHSAAVNEQPQLSATERAIAEARSITEGRLAQQNGQRAMQHADAMKDITIQLLSR